MKHIYLSLLLIFTVAILPAQIVDIPDTNFRAKLLSHSPVIDLNEDGEIQVSEAENFNGTLNLDNNHNTLEEDKITDLTGIEAFVNLQGLNFDFNLVSSINISKNTSLRSFSCYKNELTNLDISQNTLLTSINLQDNNLSELDVSKNIMLTALFCSQNNLSTLDVSQNSLLITLNCGRNELSALDLSQNTKLETLDCPDNKITELYVAHLELLKILNFNGNLIETIDVSNNISLTSLGCNYNELKSLFLNNNTELVSLSCANNPISSLDISKLHKLRRLSFNETLIDQIDLSNNTLLNRITAYGAPIESIDFSKNIELDYLICGDGPIKTLDLSSNSKLKSVICRNSYLLKSVNIKNRSSTLRSLLLDNNPNLRTICVDDAETYRTEFSSTVDPNATFVEDCYVDLPYNSVSGSVTFDYDDNGCGVSDINIPNVLVEATDGVNHFSTLTDANGDYSLFVLEDSYETSLVQFSNRNHVSVNPEISTNSFEGYGQGVTADFCSNYTQNVNDVNVIFIPISEVQAGAEAQYQLVYENLGSGPSNGSIELQFDTNFMNFNSANPEQNSLTENSLLFTYTDLKPFEKRVIDLSFNIQGSPIVEEGDSLNFEATISANSTDDFPIDNAYVLNQSVAGTGNTTNQKLVLQGKEITVEEVTNYLDYIIRFQNVGETVAENIAITDILNKNLDWNTINIINSSHNFITRITNRNFIEFVFEGINLPTKQNDEEGSKAFIAFRVKPTTGLVVGSIIAGKTEVFYDYQEEISGKSAVVSKPYIDYNESLVINEVSTEIVEETTLSKAERSLNEPISLYPNPITKGFSLKAFSGLSIDKVSVYEANGKKLFELNKGFENIEMNKYASGIYFVKIQTNKGTIDRKIVKK